MITKNVVIDVSCLAHRAFHTTGGLEWDGNPTGVIFGVLTSVLKMRELFLPDRMVFAFDHAARLKRHELYPEYKGNRNREELDEQGKAALVSLRKQIKQLYTEVLPDLGFKNLFRFRGYEADDIMAKVVQDERANTFVIVTTDEDLWQCLSSSVTWYSPTKHKSVTSSEFRSEWGIFPFQWADVKALAGCKGDNVAGIDGVGNKTAAKFVAGTMNHKTKTYQKIMDNLDVKVRNAPLVSLPFDDELVLPDLVDDDYSVNKLNEVCRRFNFKSLEVM